MPPLLILEETYALHSENESDDEPMSTEMLEDIRDISQSNPNVNRRESCYKTRDSIKQRQPQQKKALKASQNIGKGSHKVFKTVVKDILQYLPPLGKYGSEVYHFIPEPRKLKLPNFHKETLGKGNSEGD